MSALFNLLSPALEGAYQAVSGIAAVLVPLLGGTATAASIVLFTALIRLTLHPLARAQVRAEKARTALAPAVAKLKLRHKKDPAEANRQIAALYQEKGVSMAAGCLPMLVQAPVLFVMYRLFISRSVAGHANGLLSHALFGVTLGSRMSLAGIGVFAVLIAVILATATWTVLRTRKVAAASAAASTGSARSSRATSASAAAIPSPSTAKMLQFLPYATAISAAVLPLATGIYLATTTLWTAAERAYLTRDRPAVADHS